MTHKQKELLRKWSRIVLFGIMAISCLALIIVGVLQWRRMHTETMYQGLAQKYGSPASIQSNSVFLTQKADSPELTMRAQLEPMVDTKALLKENPDYAGWIRIAGTKIEYPFVRSQDNEDYLYTDFYNKVSEAGTIFMDYRNIGNFPDPHLVLYGHHMKNQTMFTELVKYSDPDFMEKHGVIELSGLYETRRYRVFSIYTVSADDYTIDLQLKGMSPSSYLGVLSGRSLHASSQNISEKMHKELSAQAKDAIPGILTLVTCSYDKNNGRMIVHALEEAL